MSNIKCYNNHNNKIGHIEYKDLETVDFTLQNTGNTSANVRLFASNLGVNSISDSGTTLSSVNSGPDFFTGLKNYVIYNDEGYIINTIGSNLDIFDAVNFTGSPTSSSALTNPFSGTGQNIVFLNSINQFWVFTKDVGGLSIDRFNLTTKALISNDFIIGVIDTGAHYTLLESKDKIIFYSGLTAYEFEISSFTLLSSIPLAAILNNIKTSYILSNNPLKIIVFGEWLGAAHYQIVDLTNLISTNFTQIDPVETYVDSVYDSINGRYIITTPNNIYFLTPGLILTSGPTHGLSINQLSQEVSIFYDEMILAQNQLIIGSGNQITELDLGGNILEAHPVTPILLGVVYNESDLIASFITLSNDFVTLNVFTGVVNEYLGLAIPSNVYYPQYNSNNEKFYFVSDGSPTGIIVETVFDPQIKVLSSSGAGDNLNGLLNIFIEKTHNPINIEYIRIDCFGNEKQPLNPLKYIYVTSRGISYGKDIPLIWARTTLNKFPILILDKKRLANEYVAVDGKRGFNYKIEANSTIFIEFGYKQDVRTDGENLDLSMSKDGIYNKVKGYLD